MKSLGIMRRGIAFPFNIWALLWLLAGVSSERGCSWNIHFAKVFNFVALVSA